MPSTPLACALLFGATACTVGDPGEVVALPDAALPGERAQVADPARLEALVPDVCDLLPADGPCSVACDPGALREWVPEGTCAAFRCELIDGRAFSVHSCR